MSANPQPRPLVTGDLDLLISRSLDGDLPGEEERELKCVLAADPAARARYEAMAALVGRLEELPDPETPFALATRVSAQVDTDTKGLAATLHRFGFYFRPATVGVVVAGIVAVAIASTVMSPPKPVATVAAAKEQAAPVPDDDGRVNVFFGESTPKGAPPAPAVAADAASAAAPAKARAAAAPAESGSADAEPATRQQAVLIASAESAREKEEAAYAPERDAPSLAAAAPPAAPAARGTADENVSETSVAQKSASPEAAKRRTAGPQAAGTLYAAGNAEVVGKAEGRLRLAAPAPLAGLAGPFDGTFRLELDGSGRVTDVARLFGGTGVEPPGLPERLKTLSFAPAEEARTAGSVDVRVRLR